MTAPTPEQNHSRLVSLRLTPAEHKIVSERAEALGKSVSQVLRDGLSGYGMAVRCVPQQTFVNGALYFSSVANVEWGIR